MSAKAATAKQTATNLSLVTTAAPVRPNRIPSPRQQEITANLSLIARTWSTLTDAQRQSFVDFGKTWSPTAGKTSAPGFIVFQSLNGVRLSHGQTDILTQAPLRPDFIGKLPSISIGAFVTAPPALALSDDSPAADPGFRLTAETGTFPGPVQVLATRPLSPGVVMPKPKDFRQISLLPSMPPGVDLTDAYLSAFPAPPIGMKVAVQFIPVTANGFQGNAATQIVTVSPAH